MGLEGGWGWRGGGAGRVGRGRWGGWGEVVLFLGPQRDFELICLLSTLVLLVVALETVQRVIVAPVLVGWGNTRAS